MQTLSRRNSAKKRNYVTLYSAEGGCDLTNATYAGVTTPQFNQPEYDASAGARREKKKKK